MLLSMGILDLLLDIAVLSLPVFVIKQLKLDTKRKIIATGLLWMGGL